MLDDTRQALLRAIRDQPDDDAPRLIYADWLDEQGDADRATFIRLQCAYERLPYWSPERATYYQAFQRLLVQHRKRWHHGLPLWARGPFVRGFIHRLDMTGAMFLRSMPEIWRIEPVTFVQLRGSWRTLQPVFRQPLLGELRELQLYRLEQDDGSVLRGLMDSPFATGLHELELSLYPATSYSIPTLGSLFRWSLPQLRRARFSYGVPAPDYLIEPIQIALHGSQLLKPVTDAMLLGNRSAAVAEAFRAVPTPNLERLCLTNNSDAPWLAAVQRKRLLALRSLMIPGCKVAASDVTEFAASKVLGRLTQLSLYANPWTHTMLQTLFQSLKLRRCESLYLNGSTGFSDRTAKIVAQCSHLKKLKHLNVAATSVSAAGLKLLRQALPHCLVVG